MSDERVQRQKKWKLEMGSMSIALEVIMGVRIVKTPAEKEDDDWSVRAGLEWMWSSLLSCICWFSLTLFLFIPPPPPPPPPQKLLPVAFSTVLQFASKRKEGAQNTNLIRRSAESHPSKSVRRFFNEERLHGRRYLNSTPYIAAILHILLFNWFMC